MPVVTKKCETKSGKVIRCKLAKSKQIIASNLIKNWLKANSIRTYSDDQVEFYSGSKCSVHME